MDAVEGPYSSHSCAGSQTHDTKSGVLQSSLEMYLVYRSYSILGKRKGFLFFYSGRTFLGSRQLWFGMGSVKLECRTGRLTTLRGR